MTTENVIQNTDNDIWIKAVTTDMTTGRVIYQEGITRAHTNHKPTLLKTLITGYGRCTGCKYEKGTDGKDKFVGWVFEEHNESYTRKLETVVYIYNGYPS